MTLARGPDRAWWKEAVVYQIYPRSFNDTTGNGNGDLPGITAKLDYLVELGVDVVWLSPVYDSPMNDNGYDIRDYRAIADLFGTMADFDEMLEGMHERGIRLIMDLVVNHTSSEHRWFQDARRSSDSPYRAYYHWHPPSPDGGPPTNWQSCFGGSAWTYDERAQAYYLHLFDATQPDLNWTTPEVRADVYDVMRFWLDQGVDGFRMDVIPFISKPPFEDDPRAAGDDLFGFYANGPHVHDYLREMHDRVLSDYDVMTVGEGQGLQPQQASLYAGQDRRELQSFFYFEHVNMGRAEGDWNVPVDWTLPALKRVIAKWDDAFGSEAWPSVFLGNHDLPRAVSHYGDDRTEYRVPSAKLLATLLLTLRGTPYIYQGDEIGMTNAPFETVDDFADVNTLNDVREKVKAGWDREAVLAHHRAIGRDNARTPMQWDVSEHAGFTTGDPWLMVNPNYTTVNVERDRRREDSVIAHYRRLISLRHESDVLVYGAFDLLRPADPSLFLYTRTLDEDVLLIVLNFSAEQQSIIGTTVDGPAAWTLLLGTHATGGDVSNERTLEPYEGRIYRADR